MGVHSSQVDSDAVPSHLDAVGTDIPGSGSNVDQNPIVYSRRCPDVAIT
jgi:hypothetical protein